MSQSPKVDRWFEVGEGDRLSLRRGGESKVRGKRDFIPETDGLKDSDLRACQLVVGALGDIFVELLMEKGRETFYEKMARLPQDI